MILRYYDTDYMTYMENELLFVGSPEQCYQYLFKNWSVDADELKDNPELYSTFRDYLKHIQFAKDDYGKRTVEEILEEFPSWDNTRWYHIDSTKLVFNKELIEIVVEEPGPSDNEEGYWDALEEDMMIDYVPECPEDEIEDDELWDTYLDALGGDWEG